VSTPTGTVGFSSNGAGAFSPTTSCTLAAVSTGIASCTVTYTPSAKGTQTITGSYAGDPTHTLSGGETPLTVT
jgi:hypothetical protein